MDKIVFNLIAESKREPSCLKPFVTGTMAYGPVTVHSDIDIVMHWSDAKEAEKEIEKTFKVTHVGKNQQYQGYKFDFPFIGTINIIPVTVKEYHQWKGATEKMVEVKDKDQRVAIFEKLREEIKV